MAGFTCEKYEVEYSELQPRKRPKRRCGKRCLLLSMIKLALVISIIAVIPYLRHTIRCTYHDTSSEDIGVPNFYLSCGADPSDCRYYGYEYHSSDVNTYCCRDQRVHLCVYPDQPAPPPATPANQLQVLSWNVFQRPSYVTEDGQVERTCYIPRWVAQHYPSADVVTFQEMFSEGCWGGRSSIREMLKTHGYLYSTRPVQDSIHLHTAGVFLASKWPIEHQESIVFGYANLKTIKNYYIPKGAVYAKIRKKVGTKEEIYHMVGLHLFSNRGSLNKEARLHQAKELVHLLERQNISKIEPVIIAGDFNQDFHDQSEELNGVLDILSAVLARNVSSVPYSFDRTVNKLNIDVNPGDWPSEWIDYIAYKSDHRLPENATMDCVPSKTDTPISMCFCPNCKTLGVHHIPKNPNCEKIRNETDLSDHYPVIGNFIF